MKNEIENRNKNRVKNIGKKVVQHIIHPNFIVLLVMVLIVSGFSYQIGKFNNPKLEDDEKVTQLSLKDIGTLATQEAYETIVDTVEGPRRIIKEQYPVPGTYSICIFSHDFILTAGYDFDKIETNVVEKTDTHKGTITIKLPEAKILSNGIVPDSEKVYYENESIFNNLSEETKAERRKEMGKTAKETAIDAGLLEKAKTNAKTVLTAFINNLYDPNDYDIVFEDIKGEA